MIVDFAIYIYVYFFAHQCCEYTQLICDTIFIPHAATEFISDDDIVVKKMRAASCFLCDMCDM